MKTIECSKCGAVFEKTGAKDKLRRFKDKRFVATFHCPNCDARVFVKEDKTDVHLQRLQRLKRQAELLGDREEAKELDEEINQFYREKNGMNAGNTKDKGLQGEEKNIQWLVRPNYSSSGVDSFALIVVNKITNKKIKKDFPTQEEASNNIDKYIDMVKDSKTTDSLFKGQKVTAIKSEQGLREGETYTVLGEEFILKQIIGEGNATVYKLQDSSGNVIVIENPEGLFYEVKDVKAKDSKTKDTQRELLAKLAEKAGDKEYADDVRSGKVPSSMIAERINYYQTKVGDSEESESLKVKIGDIKKNMDAARKMGYDTEPYQKEIDKLETKDYSRSEQAYDEGYKAAKNGKPISDNPFKIGLEVVGAI